MELFKAGLNLIQTSILWAVTDIFMFKIQKQTPRCRYQLIVLVYNNEVNSYSCKQHNVHFKTRGIRYFLKADKAMINTELNEKYGI